jgi:hypothetical protein
MDLEPALGHVFEYAESCYQIKTARVVIFCGPSLSRERGKKCLPGAAFFPPAQRGDFRAAIQQGFNVIGLIDGTYINRPTVSAYEILHALDSGVHLLGAASLGALRAVEFERHGFQGVGTIFSWYRSGLTYRDDEVVCPLHPLTNEALTEPLVNLRYLLNLCLSESKISPDFAEDCLSFYQELPYHSRRFASLLKHLKDRGYVGTYVVELEKKISKYNESLNLKYLDSIELLNHVKKTYLVEDCSMIKPKDI